MGNAVDNLAEDPSSQTFGHVVVLLQAFEQVAGGSSYKLGSRRGLDERDRPLASRSCWTSDFADLLDDRGRPEKLGGLERLDRCR